MAKKWQKHEDILNSLDDAEEPNTRRPPTSPRASNQSDPSKGPSKFEEKRYKLAKSTNSLLRFFAIIIVISALFVVLLELKGDEAPSAKGGNFGGDHTVIPPSMNKSNFSTLEGLNGVKNAIQQVLVPLPIPGLKPVRGLLMYGPPGCGKTEIAKAAAGQFNMTFISVSCASIMSPYIGRSAINIRNVFRLARANQPCVVLFDEVDTLIPSKDNMGHGDAGSQETSKAVSEWLTEMSKEMNDVNSKVFIFAATNHPSRLDTATLRRMEKKVYVPLPNMQIRSAILSKAYSHLSASQIKHLAELTYGYSSSDLETIGKTAYSMMMEKYGHLRNIVGNLYPEFELLERAILATPASSSDREIRAFQTWSRKYGGVVEADDPPSNSRRPAGGVTLNDDHQDIADRIIVADKSFPKLEDIAGLEGIKSILQTEIYSMLRGGNGTSVLLYGSAGTGKTTIAKAIARYATEHSETPWKVLPISAQDIYSPYIGKPEKMVDALFRVAEGNQPCIIFLDEIDSLFRLSASGGDGQAVGTRIKSTFQSILSDLVTSPCKIMFMGTTNHPEIFDEPMRRRFMHSMYVPLPGRESRKQIFRRLLNSDTYQYSESALDALADATTTWSGADITTVVQAARTQMMLTLAHEQDNVTDPRHIRQDILARMVRNHVPTNSLDTVKELHAWQYGKLYDKEEDDILSQVYNPVERFLYGI